MAELAAPRFVLERGAVLGQPHIVWPGLGCPERVVIADETDSQCVCLLCPGPGWGGGYPSVHGELLPRSARGNETAIELALVEATTQRTSDIRDLGRWSEWSLNRWPEVLKLVFRLQSTPDLGGARNLLCDLTLRVGECAIQRPGSVFLVPGTHGQDARILLATDIHVATRWDRIENQVSRLFPPRPARDLDTTDDLLAFGEEDACSSDCFLGSFINPNRNLKWLIAEANRLHAAGELDLLFLTGDLVDYKYRRVRSECGSTFGDSEWSFLESILLGREPGGERLRVPLLTLTGNHDYRLFPYSLQIYGLRHCGIARDVTEEYLRRTGSLVRLRYRPRELDALRISGGEDHSLDHYYQFWSPFADYVRDLGGVRFAFLDTGPDYLCDPSHLLTRRAPRFAAEILKGISKPPSNGFGDEQVKYLAESLRGAEAGRGVALVCHAPLLNPGRQHVVAEDDPAERELTSLKAVTDEEQESSATACIAFEKTIATRGLGTAVVFRNQLPMLRALCGHRGQAFTLSGHGHWNVELRLSKTHGGLFSGNYSTRTGLGELADESLVLLQTPGLGHVKRSSLGRSLPAYRRLTVSAGRIEAAECLHLSAPPLDRVIHDWHMEKRDDAEILRFSFRAIDGSLAGEGALLTRAVCWLKMPPKGVSTRDLARMKVDPSDTPCLVEWLDLRAAGPEASLVFLTRGEGKLTVAITKRPPRLGMSFYFESFARDGGRFVSLGLRRHHADWA